MKEYTVTQAYSGFRDFQHIRAESREEAIRIAKEMESDDCVNDNFLAEWFAEVEEE